MAVVQKKDNLKPQSLVTRRFVAVTSMGVIFLLVPVILKVVDPMYLIGKYNFRLGNGTILHAIFSSELECGRFEVFLFNISNAVRFLAGEDSKLKLEEVGPFTYIEYRTHKDLLFKDGLMTYTPQLRSVFVPEDSVGNPEHINITMPNIPMLSATTLLSESPFMVRSLFNLMVSQFRSKPIVTKTTQEYMWGYKDPVLSIANQLVPGLIHFDSTGIMERMYDKKTYYHMKLGATDADKFLIKNVKQFRIITSGDQEVISESTVTFNDTYEGMAYPPKRQPNASLNILRVGICKAFPMTLCGKTTSEYGSDALVYEMGETAFGNRTLCNSKGYCPSGLMDMSPCYLGLPLALSKGHFLDGDPGLYNKLEGLQPDPAKHSSHMVIEPKIGLTLETHLSLQVNIVLGNLDYNYEARKFSDIVLPIAHFRIRQPRLPEIAIRGLTVMYITMPRILLILEICLCLLGILLICYSVKLLYYSWLSRKHMKIVIASEKKYSIKVEMPLIVK